MRTVFINPYKENIFSDDGYCIVDLLTEAELDEVRNHVLAFGYGADNPEKLRKSITSEHSVRKREFFERILPVVKKPLNNFLANYRIILITIFDKLPGGGVIKLHNHPNIVDEKKYRSVTVWIPLSDTSTKMGALHVIKGSHKIFTGLRTSKDYSRFDKVPDKIKLKYCIPLSLKSGQGVIFDDRLFHSSPPNKTTQIRTAIRLQLVPSEADLEIYSRINDQVIKKYTFDERVYMDALVSAVDPEKLESIESLKVLGEVNQPIVHWNKDNFTSIMQPILQDKKYKNQNIIRRIFG